MYYIIGILIIIFIVIIYFFAYPGIFLIKSNSISGYWTDLHGNIYYITPVGLYSFNIMHKDIIQKGIVQGTIFNNKICISNSYCGKYNIKTNSITYNDGIEWYKAQF